MKKCEQCNKIIIPYKGTTDKSKKYLSRRFCSKDCHNQSMTKEKKIYKCDNCQKDIFSTRIRNGKRFCNDTCKGEYLGKNYGGLRGKNIVEKIDKQCLYCKEIFNGKQSSKFCSSKCRAKYTASKKDINYLYNATCDNCGMEYKRSKFKKTKYKLSFCSVGCMSNYYSNNNLFSGKNSPTWNGGKDDYKGENWGKQRKLALDRDNYKCQMCGMLQDDYEKELSVHHIIPFIMFKSYIDANRLDNLVCLCEDCHRKTHTGDNHPSKFRKTYGEFRTL